jgi:hypothetical protein
MSSRVPGPTLSIHSCSTEQTARAHWPRTPHDLYAVANPLERPSIYRSTNTRRPGRPSRSGSRKSMPFRAPELKEPPDPRSPCCGDCGVAGRRAGDGGRRRQCVGVEVTLGIAVPLNKPAVATNARHLVPSARNERAPPLRRTIRMPADDLRRAVSPPPLRRNRGPRCWRPVCSRSPSGRDIGMFTEDL